MCWVYEVPSSSVIFRLYVPVVRPFVERLKMYCWPSQRKSDPVVAFDVETASTNVPSTLFEIFATDSVATALHTVATLASVSVNFTGTVLPSLKMLEPSALIGWKTPLYMYCTCVVHDLVVE